MNFDLTPPNINLKAYESAQQIETFRIFNQNKMQKATESAFIKTDSFGVETKYELSHISLHRSPKFVNQNTEPHSSKAKPV